jgi:hypothetical protein
MAGREEIPKPLRDALNALAGERAPDLIREAEAEARADVKALLRAELTRAMLARSEELLAPSREQEPVADEPGEGWWLYCVIGRGHPELPKDVAGVAAGQPRVLWSENLGAVVSPVPLTEFGEEGLKRNLNDLEWLERMARAHEAVLDAALADGTIVPMRVCTIYTSEDQVSAMLEERRSLFAESLEWLDGRAEWGVKMLADVERIESRARERGGPVEAGASSEGGAYLAGKQQEREVREEADKLLDDLVRESHARLEEWAAGSEVLRPQSREVAAYVGTMVFNGAYLVDDERIENFERVVRRLEAQYDELGVKFELTGPWPAYHFVGGLEQAG